MSVRIRMKNPKSRKLFFSFK